MIYNVRHDESQKALVLRRIRESRQFSQGWGGGCGAGLGPSDDYPTRRRIAVRSIATGSGEYPARSCA